MTNPGITTTPIRADFKNASQRNGKRTRLTVEALITRSDDLVRLNIAGHGTISLRRSAAIALALRIGDAIEWFEQSEAVRNEQS